MDDDVNSTLEEKGPKMGATGNPNASKLAALQEKKNSLEETLLKKNQELRELCMKEADLTGVIPQEMPLEPGESPPLIRRRVGTSYMLPENLIKNTSNKDESITELELEIHSIANMAEAALGLANQQNIGKTVRRQHMAQYQKHKMKYTELQEKLAALKEKMQLEQQQKQKKKQPRPTEQEDNISVTTVEAFGKPELRHSLRSVRHSVQTDGMNEIPRYPQQYIKLPYRSTYLEGIEHLSSNFYKLSFHGYSNYMEKQENLNNVHRPYSQAGQQNIPYPQGKQANTMQQHEALQPHNIVQQRNSVPQQNLQQHSPLQQQSQLQQNSPLQHSPLQHSPLQPHSPLQQRSSLQQYSPIQQHYFHQQQYQPHQYYHPSMMHLQEHPKYATNPQLHRQSNPISSGSVRPQNYPSHTIHGAASYRMHTSTVNQYYTLNPHQLQPHQQYEQNVMTSGLGGFWKKSESGELEWNALDNTWQRDKRFGSLDRRKNKRVHKRVSPNMDNKSATLGNVPYYPEHVRPSSSIKSSQIVTRRPHDNRQLVRTQSLGSVGAQTIDSVWQSDDNSSCESDNRSILDSNGQNIRKPKQKEWLETSLDSPVSPTHSTFSRSQSTVPSVLAPEEKYVIPPHIPSPVAVKQPLEIPAESNPTPRLPETNIEIFNNNVPKNCTIVQAGHCKPYHEETKPFEMSDFYKYSTKFKKSPVKPQVENQRKTSETAGSNAQKNLNHLMQNEVVYHELSRGQIPSPKNMSTSSRTSENPNSLNSSLDLSQLTPNVAEHFSQEMNAWYRSHEQQIDNNNATLV